MLLTGRGIQTPEEDIRYRGLANPYFIKLFYRALQKISQKLILKEVEPYGKFKQI
jgi:hypothetical protein